jgi:hypothetical protein
MTETENGQCMQALTPLQRRYVRALVSDPFSNPTAWCRVAGYSDSAKACKVRAHKLSHSPKIALAVTEVARQHLDGRGPLLGISVLMRIVRDDGHPQQLRAAEALLDRCGFAAQTTHTVVADDVRRDPAAMIARIREIAGRLGIDAEQLLNGMRKQPMKTLPSGTEAPVLEHEDPPAEG